MPSQSPLVLCILDGWGHREDKADNSISQATTPHWDKLWAEFPHCLLDASAEAVGLPTGQMGNSEVGHTNLGAGRIMYQDLPRIDKAIDEGSLGQRPELLGFIQQLKDSGGSCHLLGLFSPGGVHSHHRHILALADILQKNHVPVVFHPFLDGRDTPPKSAEPYLRELMNFCEKYPSAQVGSVGGRYYAMDRDQRWERIELAYNVIVLPTAATPRTATPLEALDRAYSTNTTDEFVSPTAIGSYKGMNDGDGLLMANFRADRTRQITQALLDPEFGGFTRLKVISFAAALGMVQYSKEHSVWLKKIFPSTQPDSTLGEIISRKGLKQLRAAETEKYAHVTFFFNGGREEAFSNEVRILVPSPKVATYDLQPEMSAPELTAKLTAAIESREYALIVVNYANPDMVGHTGNQEAAHVAIEAVDTALGKIIESINKVDGLLIVTADHGNVEVMENPETRTPHTAHTLNPVPFVLMGASNQDIKLSDGILADVAPTILELLNIHKPEQMTGVSLIK